MSFIVQAWALPAFKLPSQIQLVSGVSIRRVLVEPPNGQPLASLLFETESEQQSLEDSPDQQFRRIGRVLSRLSFSLLTPFHVFSARIVSSGLPEGAPVKEVLFPGTPPGIALFESKVGYKKTLRSDPVFLGGEVSDNVEVAINWFLLGLTASNSVQQVLCHWIGLEALAPLVSGPWQCPECREDMPTCPHCQSPTQGPKTVQTVRAFFEISLGVSRAEFKSLYDLRCRISHGGLGMDPDGIDAAATKAFRIQELLLTAIKRALQWAEQEPPLIEAKGFTIVGTPALFAESKVHSASFYDQPGVYPA